MLNRLVRCAFGLALFGAGIAMMLQAELGASPWEMLHQGLSRRTDISVGVIIELVGFVVLLAWIPLRQRPGIGTLMNVVEIGLVVDLTMPLLPDVDHVIARFVMLCIGIGIIAVGSGFYIGAGLGPGPRWSDDGPGRPRHQRAPRPHVYRGCRRHRRAGTGITPRLRHDHVYVRHRPTRAADLAAPDAAAPPARCAVGTASGNI